MIRKEDTRNLYIYGMFVVAVNKTKTLCHSQANELEH